jgi:hypothetical protein
LSDSSFVLSDRLLQRFPEVFRGQRKSQKHQQGRGSTFLGIAVGENILRHFPAPEQSLSFLALFGGCPLLVADRRSTRTAGGQKNQRKAHDMMEYRR